MGDGLMGYDHRPTGRVCYWPTRVVVDCPMTPGEAWRLLLDGKLDQEAFRRVLRAWDGVLADRG